MRRICLFAGYDKDGKIQDYVVYLVRKLAKISDVYYMGNGKFPPDELFKVAQYTKMFYTKKHQMRDFGSWQYLIDQLGWETLQQYDELILCNDSVYGPFYDLKSICDEMSWKGYDFWSMTADYQYNFHLHRYFMVFSNSVIKNEQFHKFWRTIPFYYDARNCELEMTPMLADLGFVGNSYIRNFAKQNILQTPNRLLKEFKAPFVKVKSFLPENEYSAGTGIWLRHQIKTQTDYDLKMINRHIKLNKSAQTWGQKIAAVAWQ